jgi:hypothetical protein
MAQCFTPLQVCAVVATKLAANGAPDPGLQSVYVSDKFVTMNRAVEREEGQRIQLRSGCGVPIVDFRDCDRVTGVTLTAGLGVFDFQLLSLLTGSTLITETDEAVGLALPALDAACPNGVGIEAWVRAVEGDAQALHPVSNEPAWFRFVWPKVTWSYDGDLGFQGDQASTTGLRGIVSSNPAWGTGPNADLPAFSGAELVYLDDEDAFPTVECDFQALAS